ncbi:nuclear transport factor 2 family protein [Paralimibaculum aggregatum]|uniref:Nuclear transport factor 2 family protein n=1 Tax=Paralimibaculum aggregatum TaxID=3036245 RepID=A0ABQ6LP92_9RHOB|nr:nuclear transport factor 2 family protein [Limibaculum sp. NKW23]GMG82105.1 nuclear transport factor 2 family protein [Limibaculum sp. NKW23]
MKPSDPGAEAPRGAVKPEHLVEIEALRILKARYFRLLDTRALDAWAALFTEDVHIRWESGGDRVTEYRGRDAMLSGVRAMLAANGGTTRTAHQGHLAELEILDAERARGIWGMSDCVQTARMTRRGFGHYHERYRKDGGEWRIEWLHLTRLWCEFGPPTI